jgi:hypothetical protein
MRFGLFGSIVQMDIGAEGHVLQMAGLLQTGGDEWELEIQPTPLLRSLFNAMPEMEQLYPVLVEVVLIFRYPDFPGFVDARATVRRLAEMGMTGQGLATLWELVKDAEERT